MRTISRLLHSMLLALIIATGLVTTSVADDQRYPVFVDCPRFAGGSHCDTLFAHVRAENPANDHPNNANIRYHLISGPGEVDKRTGLWSWKWSPGDILFGDTIEIAASFGNSSEHVTPPDEYCRFWIQLFDEPSVIFVNGHGQRKNFVFFVAAPGVHYFDITVEDPDQCDSPNVEIVNVSPAVEGLFYIENDQLVFATDVVHDDKKFVVTLVDRGSPMMYSQSFIFDTRDNPVPIFETCPEHAIITQCERAWYPVRAIDRLYPNSEGITLEVASGPGMIWRNTWLYKPSEADVGQTYEVEIIARYGHIRTVGDQSCRFNITISDPTVGIEPMDFACGDSVIIQELIPSVFRLLAFDDDCTSLAIEIVNVTPTFTGDITISSGRRRPPMDSETHQIRISPDSADLGQTFLLSLEGAGGAELYDCDLTFSVEPARPYRIRIDSLGDVEQGRHAHLDVILEEGNIPLGSFDFAVAYDASALLFQGVIQGDFLNDCGWEYFNYTYGPFGPPVDGISTGQFRVKAIATTRNGGMPSCFLPDDLPATLFTLDFLISNDRTLECTWEPIRFYWPDCNDNIIRPNGYKGSALSRDVYDADGNLVTPEDSLPTFAGVPDDCLQDQKNYPRHRLIDFQHGGIHIVCADSIDPRYVVGDINLDGVPFEIADAVLFTNYFVYGEDVFTRNLELQALASDVNGDSLLLTIEDLQYMIQIIVGNAEPYHQWDTTSPNPAFFRQEPDGVVSVATPDTLGAAWLLFDGNVNPVLQAGGMEMRYQYSPDGGTRVIIYSYDGHSFTAGPLLSNVNAPLLEVQTCTYNGAKVEAIIDQALGVNDDDDTELPDRFALMQNYPNPFNNSTVIRFDLPRATEVQLTVYNIIGQVVVQRTRYYEAGYHEFVWDGRSGSGEDVAGGVYFYRVQAGSFTETRKMLLLK